MFCYSLHTSSFPILDISEVTITFVKYNPGIFYNKTEGSFRRRNHRPTDMYALKITDSDAYFNTTQSTTVHHFSILLMFIKGPSYFLISGCTEPSVLVWNIWGVCIHKSENNLWSKEDVVSLTWRYFDFILIKSYQVANVVVIYR